MNKPNIQKTSAEVINVLNTRSAKNLPNNPSASGWTPEQIKRCFWQPLIADDVSILTELDRIVEEVNAYLDTVYAHVGAGEVEQISAAYQDFIRANEGGITALSNTTWRVLSNHLETFKAQMEEIASNVSTIRQLASDAQAAAASAATNAANTAKDASSASQSAQSANEAATEANEGKDQIKEAVNQISQYIGMSVHGSVTIYAYVNSSGKICLGTQAAIANNWGAEIDANNTAWMKSKLKDGSISIGVLAAPMFEIFGARLVEILIQDNDYNPLGEPTVYRECAGCKMSYAIAETGANGMKEDNEGNGLTRIIQSRVYENGVNKGGMFVLKLSQGLINALQKCVELGKTEIPITFTAYN